MILISGSSSDELRHNFPTVYHSAFPARSRYYNLGKNLGLDIGTLETIKHDKRNQSAEALGKVLNTSIQQNPRLSWKDLADALKALNVGVIVTSP